jgi:hypothetical protein
MTTARSRRLWLLVPVICALTAATTDGAPQAHGPQGDSYESIARLPDWSGVWVIPFQAFSDEGRRLNEPGSALAPQLTAAAAAQREAARRRLLERNAAVGQPAERVTACSPAGMPGVMRFAFGVELLFTPGRVTMLLEQGSLIRRIYTDGRSHRPDPDPTYAGDSVGHWEGDTLVVDTAGLNPRAQIIPGVSVSDRTRIIERIRLIDRTRLRIDTVVDDPVVLLKPWTLSRVYERSTAGSFERYCDNNRDADDREPDLTPPPRR